MGVHTRQIILGVIVFFAAICLTTGCGKKYEKSTATESVSRLIFQTMRGQTMQQQTGRRLPRQQPHQMPAFP